MGLLYTPEHGYAAFTVPHFDQFMLRARPHPGRARAADQSRQAQGDVMTTAGPRL